MAQSKKLFHKTFIFMPNYLRKSTNFKIEAKKILILVYLYVSVEWISLFYAESMLNDWNLKISAKIREKEELTCQDSLRVDQIF